LPGRVLEAEDLSGLRDVGQERVVTEALAAMGIEAAEGPLGLRAGAHHGAVHVDREPGHRAGGQGLDDEAVVAPDERGQRGLRDLLQPVAQRPRGGKPGEPAEAGDERIGRDIPQLIECGAPRYRAGS
jgi:hypothetical protein